MEWAPFKSLFWNTNNDPIANLMISYKRRFFEGQTFLLKYVNL